MRSRRRLPSRSPGPVLCVNQGQTVTVNLHNNPLAARAVVDRLPGPGGRHTGSRRAAFAAEASVGGDVSYSFVASQPGTYLYESGSNQTKQVEMGMYGALVVRPTRGATFAYDDATTQFDPAREYILVFNEIDPVLHHAVETGGAYDFNTLHNRYFTINGREFPDTIQDNGVSWLPNQPYGALVRVQPVGADESAAGSHPHGQRG